MDGNLVPTFDINTLIDWLIDWLFDWLEYKTTFF